MRGKDKGKGSVKMRKDEGKKWRRISEKMERKEGEIWNQQANIRDKFHW